MVDKKGPIDPSAQFQEFVSDWERGMDKFFNQMMGTDQFSQSMNEMQKLQLEFQKTFRESMAQNLLRMNMPSRDDLMQVSENVRMLDLRLSRIEEMLTAMLGNNEPKSKRQSPPRTKRPPRTKTPSKEA
tara:strand:- start:5089 stop:5475 length:387 start_codon:yes stop_codon:yes gene_type:complete